MFLKSLFSEGNFTYIIEPSHLTWFDSPKLIPWFVSDVTPPDFTQTITSLLDVAFFPRATDADEKPINSNQEHLTDMVNRWKRYVDSGVFSLSVPLDTPLGGSRGKPDSTISEFWTSPWPYWNMEELAPELFRALKGSDLVIFKVKEVHCASPRCLLYNGEYREILSEF